MAKGTKKPKLCVYCGKDKTVGKMSAEHFVPKCLWAGRRPEHTRTVPAHVTCNAFFAADNDYFRTVIAFDAAEKEHPEAQRVIEGPVSRLMVDRTGQFLRQTKDFAMRPRILETGLYIGHQPSFTIDVGRIERVLRNIVKGLFYTVTGSLLEPHKVIRVEPVGMILDRPTRYFVDHMSPWADFGDDVFSCRYGFKEGMDDMCCLLAFYGRRLFFATTNDD